MPSADSSTRVLLTAVIDIAEINVTSENKILAAPQVLIEASNLVEILQL